MQPPKNDPPQVPIVLDASKLVSFNPATAGPGYLPVDLEVEPQTVPLAHYVWILRRHRWRISAFVLACVAASVIICSRLTPIYESTATIDIDRRMPPGIFGAEAVQSASNDADQFLATQIRLLQSDSVLRPVAEKYNLREAENENWQEELKKDAEAGDTPVILRKLKVTRPPNTYLLLVSYQSKDKKVAADVANGIAQSYLEHIYKIRYRAAAGLSQFMEKQQEELKVRMEKSSAALAQFEKELNVISPEERTNILSARLLELNSEYTKAQGDRVRKEAAFNSMRNGSMDAAFVSSQGEALKKLTESYNEARQRFADIHTRFGTNHPEFRRAQAQLDETKRLLDQTTSSITKRVEIEYREAANREQMLERAVGDTKKEFDRLNARSFEYQTLKREAEADKRLYEELVRKIKEAGINASFQNSSIRVADWARPGLRPVFPRTSLYVALSFLLSLILSVGLAILHDSMDDTLRDPEQASRSLRTQVVGTLPQVKSWRTQLGSVALLGAAPNDAGAAQVKGLSQYEDAIRTLRNSILLGEMARECKTLLFTSAAPSEGKSTTAVHLAIAHAQQHHKTLLVDCDLRRPTIHKRFGVSNAAGLSDVLLDGRPWESVLMRTQSVPNLAVMPAGSVSRKSTDIVGQVLPAILEEAGREFDLVILDAPPLLGFPEPLQMAALVDGVVIVARAGQTSRKGVAGVLSTLQRLRANIVGVVLNEVHKEISNSYYYYGYYGKYYKHYNSGTEEKS
ncbi:MAG: polysaccharide biosynthesis tyrosine autokinase [Bryobacterales bacterium]|nr:polysaccharide biosynthesis tyrosine autokinase [Bryobacterales bacterium]